MHVLSLGLSPPLCILELSRPTRIEYGSQKHNYNCNIQGVCVHTNVSANYMFRPLLQVGYLGQRKCTIVQYNH